MSKKTASKRRAQADQVELPPTKGDSNESSRVLDEIKSRSLLRATLRRSVPVDQLSARSIYFAPELDCEIEVVEPVDHQKAKVIGEEYILQLARKELDKSARIRLKDLPLLTIPANAIESPNIIHLESGGWIEVNDSQRSQIATATKDAVFRSCGKAKGPLKTGVFYVPSDDIAVTVPVSDAQLSSLHEGDACELFFLPDSQMPEAVSEEVATLLSVSFLRKKPDQCRVDTTRRTDSARPQQNPVVLSVLPVELREPSRHIASPGAANEVPTANEILAEIAAVQGPIIRKLNAWLASFEGKTFTPIEAVAVVEEIRHVVASAGCQLVLEGQAVSLSTSTAPRSKAAAIYVFTIGEGRAEKVYGKSAFPRFTATPITR